LFFIDHLHIHITHINVEGVGFYLNDVIDNLIMDDLFYTKKTITYQLGKNHILYGLFEENNKNHKRANEIEESDNSKKQKLE